MKCFGMRMVTICLLFLFMIAGCDNQVDSKPVEEKRSWLNTENEIVSYQPVDVNKTIITIGKASSFEQGLLVDAIEKKFPDIEIVTLDIGAGSKVSAYMNLLAVHDDLPDIIISAADIQEQGEYLYDLSGEDFLGKYSLSALESVDIDGQIFQVPLSSEVMGIFYNKTLFEQYGWEIPTTLDEFYMLCDTITAEGIRPFVPCLKYFTTLEAIGFALSYEQALADTDRRIQLNKFLNQEVPAEGLMEPVLETLKYLYDQGIVTDYDFTSSATTNRHDLYAGDIAMLPYTLGFEMLYQEEKPACDIGMFGFPTETPNKRWMKLDVGNRLSVSSAAMTDLEKKQAILNILDYLSSDEGQSTLLATFAGISSITKLQANFNTKFEEVKDCIISGRVFSVEALQATESQARAFQDWMSGKINLKEILQVCNALGETGVYVPLEADPIGMATTDFSRLEASIFNADMMREASGADISLLLNSTFYYGNLARIYEGEIKIPERFYLKGLAGDAYLTTYEITGENLKLLMEHPLVNGEEINAMYAVSGLKMEYAPWADSAHNVRALTLADGSEIGNQTIYRVAAWKGTVDEKYISQTVESFEALGTNVDLMREKIKEHSPISPVNDGRIQLNWDVR